MPTPANKTKFGEWLPDQEPLDNPGLTVCQNLLFVSGNYVPYNPVADYQSGGALPTDFIRVFRVRSGVEYLIAGTHDPLSSGPAKLFWAPGIGTAWTDVTPGGLTDVQFEWNLAQYNDLAIAVNRNDLPQYQTISGSPTAFVQLTGVNGPAPIAGTVGIIGQFVILGNIPAQSESAVQWCVVNDPTNWPTPGSAAAIAGQSGIQFLDASLGPVLGIIGGDQWGVILCQGGLVRMLYQGGDVVFQFDTYAREPGPYNSHAFCKIGQKIYYAGFGGFRVTDGTTTASLGDGRIDQTFITALTNGNHGVWSVECGVDYKRKIIYWVVLAITDDSGAFDTLIFAYNYEEDKWTNPQDRILAFVQNDEVDASYGPVEAFGAPRQLGIMSGTPSTAVIETGEAELNPGSHSLATGYRPQISGSSGVTVKIGSRNSQNDSVTYTAALTPTPSTGFADCMVDAGYHRAQISIPGDFLVASGGEFRAQATGQF